MLAGPGLECSSTGEIELEGLALERLIRDFPQNAAEVVFWAHLPWGNAVRIRIRSPLDPLASAPPRLQLLLVKVENARAAALAAAIGGLRAGTGLNGSSFGTRA